MTITMEDLLSRIEKLEAKLKNERSAKTRRIPEDFQLREQDYEWAEKQNFKDIERETERFVDYWRAAGTARADWYASWRNWIRKAQDIAATTSRRQPAGQSRPASRTTTIAEANRNRASRTLDQLSPVRPKRLGSQ